MSNVSKEFEVLEHKRELVAKEANSFNIIPISFEVYKKTPKEKMDLANAKSIHKSLLKAHYGKDYKKQLNIH